LSAFGQSIGPPGVPPGLTLPSRDLDALLARQEPQYELYRRLAADGQKEPFDHFIDGIEQAEVRLGSILRLLPPPRGANPARHSRSPQLALFAQPRGRTFLYLSHAPAAAAGGARDGEVLFQKIVVPDLFTHRQFSLQFREEHAVSKRDVRLMRFGLQMRVRDLFQVGPRTASLFVLGGYDVDRGASGFLAVSLTPAE
jgi:hypothetical protein